MPASFQPLLPSFRKQQLLLEYAALQQHCPEGIYLSLTPDNLSLWPGVFFVREGPYASAILRLLIAFPDTFPEAPPLITFSTDIFHPLVVPLTTYSFSAAIPDSTGSVATSGNEKLPPGSFNLTHGFPLWFANRKHHDNARAESPSASDTNTLNGSEGSRDQTNETREHGGFIDVPSILTVLEYMKSSFQDAFFLDQLPLEAAGNPSALHAWRAYRGLPKLVSGANTFDGAAKSQSPMRHPGDWNWDGVWESRVLEGIETSVSEGSLYGTKTNPFATSEPIRFSKLSDDKVREVQESIVP